MKDRHYYNDVWSSADGLNWVCHLEHAPSQLVVIELAGELRDLLNEHVGGEAFLQAYRDVTRSANAKRQERKRKAAQLRVMDPAAGARRRLRRNANKRESRKRKITEMRERAGR